MENYGKQSQHVHKPVLHDEQRCKVKSASILTRGFAFNLQVEIEGLTGEIRFNDDGRRHNYTLHVVEMTVNSAMVKVNIFFTQRTRAACPFAFQPLRCEM